MYISAEHARFLDIDPTGADMKNIQEMSKDILVYFADCYKKGMTDQEILCAWHHVSRELAVVMDNTAQHTRH